MKNKKQVLIILGIIFTSINLRPAIASVGPLANLISKDLMISHSIMGLITTIPIIAFAICSPFVPKLISKLGPGITMLSGLISIFVGILIRSYTGLIGVFIGTILIGLGIGIGNVLLPSLIKLRFPDKVGVMTSIYTTSMAGFAAVALGFSVPLATELNLGWRNSLGFWAMLAFIGIIAWMPQVFYKNNVAVDAKKVSENLKNTPSMWKSSLAWKVTLYFGVQAILFYCILAWMPSILQSHGISPKNSGYIALFLQLITTATSLIIPVIGRHFKDQRVIAVIFSSMYLLGTILFLFSNYKPILFISIVLIGIGIGSSLCLAMLFIGLRSSNAKEASELSGMAQCIGHMLAAVGPILIGAIYDFTASWTVPILIFIAFNIALIYFSISAGANKVVFEDEI
ncbi:CynX/NimT family MFS transporter [Clostridium cylindrosporum]|uniref:Cyanate permease n=1 Tax=Clostridium cylindrosporum DSM 605 TaxID=1121307 RepID=A0A0J8D8S7_CLOCY|nr:MFS transporter [Clostridium cylindrosporum]KMT22282.1 cyanate permease [Clostridium cylindrosporum DSM 605]